MQKLILKYKSQTFAHLLSAILLSSFYYIIQFVFTKIISGKISIADFGEYRYFFSILSFGALFSIGFIDGFQIEWIVNKQPVNNKYISAALIFTLLTSFVAFFLFDNIEISMLAVINLVIINAGFILQYIFIKFNFFLFYLIPIIFSQFIQILIFEFLPGTVSLTEIFYIHTGLNFLFIIAVYIYCYQKKYIQTISSQIFNIKEIPRHIKNGLPILLSGIMLIGFLNIDKLILKTGYLENDYGYYCFASLVAMVVYGVFASVGNMLLKKMVDAKHIDKLYNNTIYFLMAIPFIVLLTKGIVIKGVEIFFSKYLDSIQYYIGFVNFYFPLLANNLVILNTYKKHNQVTKFVLIAVVFLITQAALLLWAKSSNMPLVNVPFLMALVMGTWFFINDFVLSYKDAALGKKYWLRTAICLTGSILVFIISYNSK
ncbi:MAG: hypothetical protein V4556_03880 [Bacteroidota bacterium]